MSKHGIEKVKIAHNPEKVQGLLQDSCNPHRIQLILVTVLVHACSLVKMLKIGKVLSCVNFTGCGGWGREGAQNCSISTILVASCLADLC